MEKGFESYLQYIHSKEYTGIKDDMPDAFDAWLDELDADEFIKYGDEFAEEKVGLNANSL